MNSISIRLLSAIVGMLLVVVATVAVAHHSAAMFDDKQRVTLTGTVRTFQWGSPHCYVQLLVKGQQGEEEWSLEMGAPMYLYRLGWRPSSLKSGDQVTVQIAPLRSGGKGGLLLEAMTADGAKIGKKS
jgi:hypothetical protein